MTEDNQFKSLKILIADDLGAARKVLARLLQELGFQEILQAKDGQEALEMLKQSSVDLIISDWEMPRLTGIDLLEKLREIPELSEVPFIMITSNSTKEAVLKAAGAGVSTYIGKPFTKEVLQEKISNLLAAKTQV